MTTTDDAVVTAPEAQDRRRARLLPWAVVLTAALAVLALVGGARLLVHEREHAGDEAAESMAREPWLAAHNVDSEWASCDE